MNSLAMSQPAVSAAPPADAARGCETGAEEDGPALEKAPTISFTADTWRGAVGVAPQGCMFAMISTGAQDGVAGKVRLESTRATGSRVRW